MTSATTSGKSYKQRAFVAILGVLLLARLDFASLAYSRPKLALANDTDRYVPIANAILSGQAYRWNAERPGELLNTIGYPLFLSGVFVTLGHDAGDVALAQLLITGALALLTYLALSRWLGHRSAFLSGLLLAIDPLTILWSMTILTETLFAVTLGIGAVLLTLWAHSQRGPVLVVAALFTALACLVKPFAMLIAAIWALGILLFVPASDPPAGVLRRSLNMHGALLFVLPILLLIVPWFVRNGLLWNCPTLSSVDRVTMRDYMAAKVMSEAEHLDLSEAQARLQAEDPGVCPTETMKYWRIITDNPAIYLRLHVAGTVPVLLATNFDRWLQYFGGAYELPDLWRPYMDEGWRGPATVILAELRAFPRELGLMAVLTAFQLLLYALGFTGMAAALRLPSRAAQWNAIVLLLAILLLVLAPGQGGHERFRVPVQPLLAILAAYGVSPVMGDRAI